MASIAMTSAEERAGADAMLRVYERGGSQCIAGRRQISTVPIAGSRPRLGRLLVPMLLRLLSKLLTTFPALEARVFGRKALLIRHLVFIAMGGDCVGRGGTLACEPFLT